MEKQTSAAFLSYVHSDDEHDGGRITGLRERLEGEVRMHIGQPFRIFQDRNDLEWGQNWSQRIEDSLNAVTFLIPVVTPSFFRSPACRKEFDSFLIREQSLGTNRLILPIYYLDCDEIEETSDDSIAETLKSRQWSDWRPLRFFDLRGPEVSSQLASQATMIKRARKELDSLFSDATTSKLDDLITERHAASGSHSVKIQDGSIENKNNTETPKPTRKSSRTRKSKISGEKPYAAYTIEYDEIIRSMELLNPDQALELGGKAINYAEKLQSAHMLQIKKYEQAISEFENSAISILVDNSGSLRGAKISATAAWSILLIELFDRAGWKTELLGFTTRSWKGGQSREKWLSDGRPPSPGRLADLRHIIYKSFEESTVGFAQNVGAMLKEAILKENIDGEALLWAHSRISKVESNNKIILVISDGAPVDDSTLTVNSGSYLERHLRQVLTDLAKSEIDILAVGIEHDVRRYYGKMSVVADGDTLGIKAIDLVKKSLQRKKAKPAAE